jgi:hypothetical protein
MMVAQRQDGFKHLLLLIACLLAPGWAKAQSQATPPKPLLEFWEAVFLQRDRVGYAHGVFRQPFAELIDGEEEMRLTIHRFGSPMLLQFKMTMQETPQGQVRQFTHRQTMGRDEELIRVGLVEQGRLRMTKEIGSSAPEEKMYPWNDRALGLYAQEQLYRKHELKPGAQFDFRSFVPEFNSVLSTAVAIGEKQPTELLEGKKVPLWRVAAKVEKIRDMQFPPMICWVSDSGEVVKREQNIPGLGDMTFYRTSKDRALAQSKNSTTYSDIGYSQLVKVNRSFHNFNSTKEVIYRVKLDGIDDVASAFVQDQKQQVKVLGKNELEIRVKMQDPPRTTASQLPIPSEYLRSNHFVTSNDPEVQKLARQVVRNIQDPWEKAKRIESWVRQNMSNHDYGKAFATAAETAKTLDGDCTEHSVLAAAMCRAAGVPSRTAIGLVHVPTQQAMCFHMWFEVWIAGEWYALDGTLGQGYVGAGHVKVVDAHWNDTDSFLPLMPVVKLLGKIKMDVVSVEYDVGPGRR